MGIRRAVGRLDFERRHAAMSFSLHNRLKSHEQARSRA
jgi:hypothetical protein